MRNFKKITSFFLAMVMCLSLCVPALAEEEAASTARLLEDFKEIAQEVDYTDEALMPYIQELASRADEFTDQELISMIADNSEDADYRRGLLETYLSKYDFCITDAVFLDLLQDPQFDDGMKMLIIVCLEGDLLNNPRLREILIDLSDSTNPVLAYHAIKGLTRVDMEKALEISYDVLENMDTECDEKVNIALNVLAMNYPQIEAATYTSTEDSSFIGYLCGIYADSDSQEIKTSVLLSLELMDTADATAAREYLLSVTPSPCADGAGGYAAYRDGVGSSGSSSSSSGNLTWHAAIVTSGVGSSATYVEASGPDYNVRTVNYNTFLNGQNFMGYYQPSSLSSYGTIQRNYVVSSALTMANLHIPYVFFTMIEYYSIPSSQTHYKMTDIKTIRCDGVVEFCFETNGIRVCGPSSNSSWDITMNNSLAQTRHAGFALTPKEQAQSYMTRVNLT